MVKWTKFTVALLCAVIIALSVRVFILESQGIKVIRAQQKKEAHVKQVWQIMSSRGNCDVNSCISCHEKMK